MQRISCFCIALAFLPVSIVLADTITNVSVSGTVSGNGFMRLRCFTPQPGCVPDPGLPGNPLFQGVTFDFSETNTNVRNFQALGEATGIGPTTIGGYGSQSTTATADSLHIELFTGWFISPIEGAVSSFIVSVDNDISVAFDLTTESLVQVSGEGSQLFDSSGNSILPTPFCCSASVVLLPGTYQFERSLPLTGSGVRPIGDLGVGQVIGSISNLNFAPIPEPRFAWLAAIAVALGFLLQRRRKIAG